MVDNTTELLRIVLKGMSEKGIELDSVDLYKEAVDINNKVKVCIANDSYLVHRVNEGGGFRCWDNYDMIYRVLKLLKPDIKKGDYVTDGIMSGVLISVDEDKYTVVDLKKNETIYFNYKSLEELHELGWRKG